MMVKNRGIFDFFLPKSSASNLHYNDAKKLSMYFRLICTKIMKVHRPIFVIFWKTHPIYTIMMSKNQLFSTYLYQNHNSISTYICKFLKNYLKFTLNWIPKNRYFRIVWHKITIVYRPIFVSFWKITSNVHYNSDSQNYVFSTCLYQNHKGKSTNVL